MRSNTSHSETGKFEDVIKIYIMIRNTEFNWELSLIKMTTNLLHDKVTIYFAMLVIATMKVTNQPMNL